MQSGITVSDELHAAFKDVQSTPSFRGLIVGIEKESLVPVTKITTKGNFEDDLGQLDSLTKENEAAYILLRQRENSASDMASFVAITYVPDTAHVRQKMLFASTRNTLLRELGTEKFSESVFMTMKSELSAEGFRKHASHNEKPAPLTEEEQTLRDVKEAEAEASVGTMSRAQIGGKALAMQASDEAVEALKSLGQTKSGVVQLMLDMSTERIELANHSRDEAKDIRSVVPKDVPRYTFFAFNHTFEGEQQSPILFLYTCPGESKIKERMVYAASRRTVVAVAEQMAGLTISKRLEADVADEITESHLLEELHPKREEKGGFQRPKRPGRK